MQLSFYFLNLSTPSAAKPLLKILNIYHITNIHRQSTLLLEFTISSELASALEPLGNTLHINFKINNTI